MDEVSLYMVKLIVHPLVEVAAPSSTACFTIGIYKLKTSRASLEREMLQVLKIIYGFII